jgi:hypothetical protein
MLDVGDSVVSVQRYFANYHGDPIITCSHQCPHWSMGLSPPVSRQPSHRRP